jgi:demethylmenaquinone methyltransferase/2-methoxy-6-polyprenyl-1,4-benzoquinol methylase
MLDRARAKAPSVRFEQGDALNLKYADDEFDAATVAFGARNFAHVGQGLREMVRVVRPGGRVVILDFTTPSKPPLSTFFGVWFDQVVPMIGRAARQREAYEYLSRSVRRYPPPVEIAAEMASSGMRDVRFIVTAGGIVTLHVGTVED